MHTIKPLAILEEILGVLVEFVLELVFEFVFGAIFELIGDALARIFPPLGRALTGRSGVAFLAAAFAGMLLGVASMLVRPQPVAEGDLAVSAAILLAPLPMAGGMVLAGRLLEARNRERSGLERWGTALTFAYAFVLTRVVFRHFDAA